MTATRDPDRLIRAYLAEGRTELSTDGIRRSSLRHRTNTSTGRDRPVEGTRHAHHRPIRGRGRRGPDGRDRRLQPDPTERDRAGRRDARSLPRPRRRPLRPARPRRRPHTHGPRALAAGTYTTSLVWDVPFTTTFTAPAGWQAFDIEITKEPVMYISFEPAWTTSTRTHARRVPLDPPIGPNVSDLAEGLRRSPGFAQARAKGSHSGARRDATSNSTAGRIPYVPRRRTDVVVARGAWQGQERTAARRSRRGGPIRPSPDLDP